MNVKMQNHNSFPQKVMCGDAEQRTVPLNAANPDFDLGKKHLCGNSDKCFNLSVRDYKTVQLPKSLCTSH